MPGANGISQANIGGLVYFGYGSPGIIVPGPDARLEHAKNWPPLEWNYR